MAHRIVTEPERWNVMRAGGWSRSARGAYVVFAVIHVNSQGKYDVMYQDDRMSEAALDLDVHNKTYTTQLEASKDAHKVVALALEIKWAQEDAQEAVRTKHGVKE